MLLSASAARAVTSRIGSDAAPDDSVSIALDLLGGDVWAWSKSIAGTCHGVDPNATIDILVNDEGIPAVRNGDTFGATVRLRPGANTVQAIATTGASTIHSHSVIHTVRLSPRPTARITLSIGDNGISLDGTGSEASEYDAAPITGFSWFVRSNDRGARVATGTPEAPDGSFPEAAVNHEGMLTLPIPRTDGEYLVSLTVSDDRARDDTATAMVAVEQGRARRVDPVREEAAWTEGATLYGIVVRNVGDGTFQSVIDRLDDLADLSIAALWLAPITSSIPGHFGYEVTDYFDVRPEYGTLADFKRLVDEAHARDIRVLVDVVPNHTSIEHPYYRNAERDGSASPYYDFYDRDERGACRHYFDWTHLPNLNFDNQDVRRFMTEAFMFWVREMDVDGFRVDVAWGIRQRRPDYWLELSAEFNRVKRDGLLIAEASARDPYFVNNGFDAAYDWTGDLGVWAWADVFAGDASIPEGMRQALANSDGDGYDPDSFVLRFLNNNDTGPRFITTHGVDLYRVASAMLLTLPGLPCIYTGDEVGAEFEPYATIGDIDWTDHHDLRSHVRKLIHLRNELPGLRSREWTALAVEPANQLFGYLRFAADGASPVLILLNFGADAIEASVGPGDVGATFDRATAWTDIYNETSVTVGGGERLTIPMPAWGIRVLVPDGDDGVPVGLPGHRVTVRAQR